MSVEIFETEKYILRVYPRLSYLEYIFKQGETLDIDDVVLAKNQTVTSSPGMKFYVYSESSEFASVTKKARELCATRDHLDNTHAIAFYTTNMSVFLMGEVFNKINKPAVPTKIFMNRDSARNWLREQAYRNGHLPEF